MYEDFYVKIIVMYMNFIVYVKINKFKNIHNHLKFEQYINYPNI